jgi:hypothetical protein
MGAYQRRKEVKKMKKFLAKRWHSIPIGIMVAALLVCLLAGGAFAAYAFYGGTATITVSEPMTISPYYTSPDVTWDGNNYIVDLGPGEVARLGWDVLNNGSVALNVTPLVSPTTANGGNITTEWVMPHDVGGYQVVAPGGTERYTLKIIANGSTAPGTYIFTATFSRS